MCIRDSSVTACPITCEVDGGELPIYGGGCQAITDGTTASGLMIGAFGFNTTYPQAYFLVSGGTTIEEFVILPAGSSTNVVTFVGSYAAGTYEVYAVNYDAADFTPSAATVASISLLPTVYSTGACAVQSVNSPTDLIVCDPACACDDGTSSGSITVSSAAGYNPSYTQEYLLVDGTGLILSLIHISEPTRPC